MEGTSHQEYVETLEKKIALLEEKLCQAQRLTAIGELASTTTHEFNNVLTTVINYAKFGLRHKDEPSRNKAFEKILASGNRAAKITQTVLGMARNRKPGKEPTDLKALLDDTLFLLEREMNKYRIQVETSFQPVPEVMIEGNQIQQVLLNLLINARQAMSGGGRLSLKIDYDESLEMVSMTVRDYGTGIPKEKLPHIFDAFYSTKDGPDESGKGGTGLGLSMCKNIIESHHGRIRVESSVGKGTAFTLKLPTVEKYQKMRPAVPLGSVGEDANPPSSNTSHLAAG